MFTTHGFRPTNCYTKTAYTNSFQSRLGINLIYYLSLGVLFTRIINDFSDGPLQHWCHVGSKQKIL